MQPPYYVLEDGKPTGPHSLLVLRQKTEVHALRPDSLVCAAAAPDATAPAWIAVRDIPELHALLFPPRADPAPRLGAARYTSTNADYDATHAGTEVGQMLRDNTAFQLAAETRVPGRKLARIGARRRRDFFLVLLSGYAFAAGYSAFMGVSGPQAIFVLAFVVILTSGLYWTMFHVMDPY